MIGSTIRPKPKHGDCNGRQIVFFPMRSCGCDSRSRRRGRCWPDVRADGHFHSISRNRQSASANGDRQTILERWILLCVRYQREQHNCYRTHCCWDRTKNNWIGGWSFAPAYNNGNAPYGVFNWAQARVLNSWINNGDTASDVCLIALQNDAAGHGVTYYTGWLGRSWNYPSTLSMHSLGYPGNIGGGNNLELCASESFAQNSSCGAGVLNTGCSMTYGSSGGPWIRDYRTGNHVDSVVHGYVNQSCTGTFGETFDGPSFTTNNIVALCNAQGC